jgi:protein involved in polysaccharide export with SLBB domain
LHFEEAQVGLRKRLFGAASLIGLSIAFAVPAMASDDPVLPKTKVRLTVVQWNPVKADYQSWQGIGGEFTVSEAGALQLPVIGRIDVKGLDSTTLATEISVRLQKQMGLLEKPNASIEVIEYPPVYVVGDATTPGEYRYRSGMTALQALALSGGPFRKTAAVSNDGIRLAGELRTAHNDILRTRIRIARLQAEIAGASDVTFDTVATDPKDANLAAEIGSQERAIFQSRIKENERQTKSLEELRTLLNAEIDALNEKTKAVEVGIRNAEEELANVTILVNKGFAVTSRRSELQQRVAGYQAERLDQVTAIMRARQNITEATRNLEGLEDRRKTEVAASLQQEMANLERLTLNQETSQKLLLDALSATGPTSYGPDSIEFVVTRNENGTVTEAPASDRTILMPGDVVTVRVRAAASPAAPDQAAKTDVTGSLSAAEIAGSEASQ